MADFVGSFREDFVGVVWENMIIMMNEVLVYSNYRINSILVHTTRARVIISYAFNHNRKNIFGLIINTYPSVFSHIVISVFAAGIVIGSRY